MSIEHIKNMQSIVGTLRRQSTDPKVQRLVADAAVHIRRANRPLGTTGIFPESEADKRARVATHLTEAAHCLRDAAEIHRGKLESVGMTPPPEVLDVGILGSAHNIVQSAVDAMNKGTKNGR